MFSTVSNDATISHVSTLDICTGYLGAVKCGKTTRALSDIRGFANASKGAYILIYDPTLQIHGTIISSHDEARSALKRGKTTLVSSEWDVLSQTAESLGAAWRNGLKTCPTALLLDESLLLSSPHGVQKDLKLMVARRRHHNVAVYFTGQEIRQCHYMLLSLSTVLYIGRHVDPRAHERLEELGFPVENLPSLATLKAGEFIRISRSGL